MAYVNVRDWSVDQVTDWLKGLDSIILQYTTSFLNNGVTGHQLLSLRAEDLYNLGVKSLGHQEVILESVEHLRHFHFELDKENLQMLALRVSCASNSLFKELLLVDDDCPLVSTHTMADVHNIITTIKPLVCWLDRAPFLGDKDYIDCKSQLLELGFEMATMAHRGKFSMQPVSGIKKICEKITKLADHIIQEISDPMILQPASLDLATLKKKEQEFGFFISPNNHAIHQIAEIKYGSPAHGSTKIEEGDEIVQVNYQTVVGWQRKNVMILLQDSPPEIVLTLKKRPRHTKVYGQIYMKPYRLPSKKLDGQPYFRWNDSIPPPRLLPIHNLSPINIPKLPPVIEPPDVETELSSSDDSEPPDSPLDGSGRMYPLKPRPILQRRNTITGATPTSKRPYPSLEQVL
jgi:connector enhancer of kinase suppressor of Ras 2